jgi:hypothetical protein
MNLIESTHYFQEIFKDNIQKYPELIPLLYNWSFNYSNDKSTHRKEAFKKKSFLSILKNLVKSILRIVKYINTFNEKKVKNRVIDFLIIPQRSAINYYGICEVLIDSLIKSGYSKKIAVINNNIMITNNELRKHIHEYQINYRINKIHTIELLRAILLFIIIKKKINKDKYFKNIIKNRKKLFKNLYDFIVAVKISEKYIDLLKPKIIIYPNEQWDPASFFLAAAKKRNIYTCQMLHGVPTKRYAPFYSNETWMWDHSTQKIFNSYGVPTANLPIVENFEVLYWKRYIQQTLHISQACKSRTQKSVHKKKKILFLSQLHGELLWDTHGFWEVFCIMASVLEKHKGNYELFIRLHPSDTVSDRNRIQVLFSFMKPFLHFTDQSSTLIDDALNADICFTGSSSAILIPIILNRQSFLIWPESLDHIHGHPFLEKKFVVSNELELLKKLKSFSKKTFSKSELKITTNKNFYAGAQRLTQLINNK